MTVKVWQPESDFTQRRIAKLWTEYVDTPEARRLVHPLEEFRAYIAEQFGNETAADLAVCRECKAFGMYFEVADFEADQAWTQMLDSDDEGYPFCPKCTTKFTKEIENWGVTS